MPLLGYKLTQQVDTVWKGSCWPFGGTLGGSLAALGPSWEPGGPDLLQKRMQNNSFQNRFSSLS